MGTRKWPWRRQSSRLRDNVARVLYLAPSEAAQIARHGQRDKLFTIVAQWRCEAPEQWDALVRAIG